MSKKLHKDTDIPCNLTPIIMSSGYKEWQFRYYYPALPIQSSWYVKLIAEVLAASLLDYQTLIGHFP